MEIQKIGVVGAGQMGAGIAHTSALSGFSVLLQDANEDAIDAGIEKIAKNMRDK